MTRYRTIEGGFELGDGTPAANREVSFQLNENDYTLEKNFFSDPPITVTLDSNGFIPQVDDQRQPDPFKLWCNGDGFKGSKWVVKEPKGTWSFVHTYDDGSPISVQTIKAGGQIIVPPDTTNSLISAAIAAHETAADPHPQYLTEAEADARYSGAIAETPLTIKTKYESNNNTNAFTDAEKSKLSSLESSKFLGTFVDLPALQNAHPTAVEGSYAHVDTGVGEDVQLFIWDNDDDDFVLSQGTSTEETAVSIKTKYESNPDTNAFSDSYKAQLDAVNFTPEDSANKKTDFSVVNDAFYPSLSAVSNFVDARISDLIGTAPANLDTLQEIAAQLADDESAVAALTTAVSGKADKTLSNLTDYATARTNLGLEIGADVQAWSDNLDEWATTGLLAGTLNAVPFFNVDGDIVESDDFKFDDSATKFSVGQSDTQIAVWDIMGVTGGEGSTVSIKRGGQFAPDYSVTSTLKVQRAIGFTKAEAQAAGFVGDGVDGLASIVGVCGGMTEVQPVGVLGGAFNFSNSNPQLEGTFFSNDACGIYGVGRIGMFGTGTGIGAYFEGRRDNNTANYTGVEVRAGNYGGADLSYYSPGYSSCGIWMTAGGDGKSPVGMLFGNPTGQQFEYGIAFNEQVSGDQVGAITDGAIIDDSDCLTSYTINGNHDYGIDTRGGTFTEYPVILGNNQILGWDTCGGITTVGDGIFKFLDSTGGGGAILIEERPAPATPAANQFVVYAEDDGAGKTRLMVMFSSGAAQQIAIQP
jgi:hypothetical protein